MGLIFVLATSPYDISCWWDIKTNFWYHPGVSVQTVLRFTWNIKKHQDLKMSSASNFNLGGTLTLSLLAATFHYQHLCKWFGPRSGSILLDTLNAFLKEFFEKFVMKNSADDNRSMEYYPACKELTLNAPIATKVVCWNVKEASMANSVEPDQTAPIGAVCSGSTLFDSLLNLSVMSGNYLQQTISADDIFRCIFFLAF